MGSAGVATGSHYPRKPVDMILRLCQSLRPMRTPQTSPGDTADTPNSFRQQPDDRGHFGDFGGRYVAETLMPNILALEQAYDEAKKDPAFTDQF